MTLDLYHLEHIDDHWSISAFGIKRARILLQTAEEYYAIISLSDVLENHNIEVPNFDEIRLLADAYELAAIENLDYLIKGIEDSENKINLTKAAAYKSFELRRIIPLSENNLERIYEILHLASLAYCGDRWTDLQRWFMLQDDKIIISIKYEKTDWDLRILETLYKAWMKILTRKSWQDLEEVSKFIIKLRNDQKSFERKFLNASKNSKSTAYRLISLYHLSKATELLATYMLNGMPVNIHTELDSHFESCLKAAYKSQDIHLEITIRWLHVLSKMMVSNSIWKVAHMVNSKITEFVKSLSKKAMFELFPPQKSALFENHLMDALKRAIVINIPTSGGKTILAQFRMLQAINSFEKNNSWIAYIAPTRALVSQITRKLRSDFNPLNIRVEQLSGALEIDNIESDMLKNDQSFQILVTTPEKLQMVLKNKKILRPLSLIIMDEAHNIEDAERGLRFELLIAQIKQEYKSAKFLLLMPFVPNSKELSYWLDSENSENISLTALAWKPNDRIIGLYKSEPTKGRGNWKIEYETLITSQRTIHLKSKFRINGIRPLNLPYYKTKSKISQSAAIAKIMSKKGTSIIVTGKIKDTWRTARLLLEEFPIYDPIPSEIVLVQNYLKEEISPNFELIKMLERGITVHHAGLPNETLNLIEWLTELNLIYVMCATTTIAQGLNFPVSSIFLATYKYPFGIEFSTREFWNLVGRAGRVNHDSVGVIGIVAGDEPNETRKYVSKSIGNLVSRIVLMLNEIEKQGRLHDLSMIIYKDEWTDFRNYIAHLWNEKRDLDQVINETEQMLRNTYGFSKLRGDAGIRSSEKAEAIIEASKNYVKTLAENPEYATLADSTGFSPESVKNAVQSLAKLEDNLSLDKWETNSIFGDINQSILPNLYGILLEIPQLKKGLENIANEGRNKQNIAKITASWVMGKSIKEIATEYFKGKNLTEQITNTCKAIYRELTMNGTWGISALSKLPTSGIPFDKLTDEQRRELNNLPAMIYYGVNDENSILMRMNHIPRSLSLELGIEFSKFKEEKSDKSEISQSHEFLDQLSLEDWKKLSSSKEYISGDEYYKIWKILSGKE